MGQTDCGTRTVATHGTQEGKLWQGKAFGVCIQTQRQLASRHPCLILRPLPGWWSHQDCSRIVLGPRYLRAPYPCMWCYMVDVREFHALSCKCSSGRLIRHNHMNDIIHRSLTPAGIPATKEPAGLIWELTKNDLIDRLTLLLWREGRCLIWDATVADTAAASYLSSIAMFVGSAAESAAAHKETKYAKLSHRYEFMPVAFETRGCFCKKSTDFVSELGRRILATIAEKIETCSETLYRSSTF